MDSYGLNSVEKKTEKPQQQSHASMCPEKSCCTNRYKKSESLLASIHEILNSNLTLTRKKSSKSTELSNPQHFKCTCKRTKCLKMYCECFAQGTKFCDGCACVDCHNTIDYEEQRASAIDEAQERDPNLYKLPSQNKQGCICKKTECLKKYCQCFSSGYACGPSCKCLNCHNL